MNPMTTQTPIAPTASIFPSGTECAEGTAACPGVAVLDAPSLAALHQLDPSGANRLVQRVMVTYRSSLDRLLGELTLARRHNDAASLRLVTHTLKSSSASVGALALSALCAKAEQAVRDGRLDDLPTLLDQLEVEAARVDAAVLQFFSVPLPNAR
jgi:HPt (histidine-containing phosphotransfer) domain-containing protein